MLIEQDVPNSGAGADAETSAASYRPTSICSMHVEYCIYPFQNSPCGLILQYTFISTRDIFDKHNALILY